MSEGKERKENPVNALSQTPRKRRWKSVLLGLVILFCGMIIGSGITFHVGNVLMFRALSPRGEMAEHVTKRIARDLALTAEQKAQVSKIVAHRISVFRDILTDASAKIKGDLESLHDEVVPILTEEQKLKWEKHYQKMEKVILRINRRLVPDRR
jgi:hypothetical protein